MARAFCGIYARPSSIAKTAPQDYVVGNGSVYATAYFDIAAVRVFGQSGTNVVVDGDSGAVPSAKWGLGSLVAAVGFLFGVAL